MGNDIREETDKVNAIATNEVNAMTDIADVFIDRHLDRESIYRVLRWAVSAYLGEDLNRGVSRETRGDLEADRA